MDISDSVKSTLATVAPMLATAVGGPLGGLAYEAIAKAFGLPDGSKTDDIKTALNSAAMSGDQIAAIKQAEIGLQQRLAELNIDESRIAADDRASARNLAVATRDKTPAILSWFIILGAGILEGLCLFQGVPEHVSDIIAGRILGTLDSAAMMVLTYWFGTSASSRNKDETIAASVKQNA